MVTRAASKVVVALDIGTSGSAWGFLMQGRAEDTISVRVPKSMSTSAASETKTVTAVLLSSEAPHRAEAFGRAAVDLYIKQSEKPAAVCDGSRATRATVDGFPVQSDKNGMLFCWFMKELCECQGYQLMNGPVATAQGGQKLPLLVVMVSVLRHFKEDVLAHLSSAANASQTIEHVLWVITIPAMYDDFSKRFMRVAAHMAGLVDAIDSPCLQLCLEPEAACLAVDMMEAAPLLPHADTKVMILDCGRGKMTMTTHNVTSVDPTVAKIVSPIHPWSFASVHKEFTTFFQQFIGEGAFAKLRHTAAFCNLLTKWEDATEAYIAERNETVRLDMAQVTRYLRFGLSDLKELCEAHNERHTIEPHLHLQRKRHSIDLPTSLVKSLLAPTITEVSTFFRSLRLTGFTSGVKCVFLVGGLSSSSLILAAARAELEGHGCMVVPTLAPDVAIVKGAVLYGKNVEVSKRCVATLTNGARDIDSGMELTSECGEKGGNEATTGHTSSTCDGVRGEIPIDASNRQQQSGLKLQLTTLQQELSKAMQMLCDEPRQCVRMESSIARLNQGLREEARRHQSTKKQLVQSREDLERATVLLKKEQQEKWEITQDRDRYRDQVNRRLLTQGTDIQAAFPTTFEIRARAERVLTEIVSDWFEQEESAMRESHPGVSIRPMVADLFGQCQAFVRQREIQHAEFFLGGASATKPGETKPMEQHTADFMRAHLRRHYTTLFPLNGAELDQACKTVVEMLQKWASKNRAKYCIRSSAVASPPSRMAKVITEYLHILVTVTLQNPPVVFSDDCGKEQPFDSSTHSQPIDGDALGQGERCIVVFPSMMQEAEDGGGFKPLSRKFILPALESSS